MSVQLCVKILSDVGCIISHGSHSMSDTIVLFKFFFLLSPNPLYYPGQLSSSSTWTSFYCLKKADHVTWVLLAGLSWHSLFSGLLGPLSSLDLRLLITLGLHLSLPVLSPLALHSLLDYTHQSGLLLLTSELTKLKAVTSTYKKEYIYTLLLSGVSQHISSTFQKTGITSLGRWLAKETTYLFLGK